LLASGLYSDLQIKCGNDMYKVHRSIVCPQSDFFAGAMRFTIGKESEDRMIDLSEDDPAAIKALVQFLYEADYEPYLLDSEVPNRPPHDFLGHDYTYAFPHTYPCDKFVCTICLEPIFGFPPEYDTGAMLLHSKVYEVAEKYQVTELKELAAKKFSLACGLHWEKDEFVDALRHACISTVTEDKGLRTTLAKTVADHMELLKKEAVKELLSENGDVAVQALELMAKRLS
ncbi:hypothetical protein CC80DRAFT_420445, partial [Byssothecium circinans]